MLKAQELTAHSGSVLLSDQTIQAGVAFRNKDLLQNINCWHKFIVYNGEKYTRNVVLTAILDHVHPLDLIPVSYWSDQAGAYFLARNCGPAIHKLCNDGLTVANSKDSKDSIPFKLNIILKFATTAEFKIDVQKNLLAVLQRRYDPVRRTLHLTKFSDDQSLKEFCPLSQPKIMFFVLHLSKTLSPPPEHYILSDNRIKILNPVEALSANESIIKSFDLRNNLISDWDTLQQLRLFHLSDLYLDGNPICGQISTEEYTCNIVSLFKELKTLDGVPLRKGEFPDPKKNYLCDFDALRKVNQFLEHYFHVYDSTDRSGIKVLYNKYALFSLNCIYHSAQVSSPNTRLHKYSNISRNIHKMANVSLMNQHLYRGSNQIMNILSSLPRTEHDPYSFSVDVMSYTANKQIIFVVSGVFRELPENLLETERMYGFARTFVITKVNNEGVYEITNEQVHVYNALSSQSINSFRIARPNVTMCTLPKNAEDKKEAINAIRVITTMNTKWSKRCLEECQYDLKKTLILFVDLFKQNKIPEEGFHERESSRSKKRRL